MYVPFLVQTGDQKLHGIKLSAYQNCREQPGDKSGFITSELFPADFAELPEVESLINVATKRPLADTCYGCCMGT